MRGRGDTIGSARPGRKTPLLAIVLGIAPGLFLMAITADGAATVTLTHATGTGTEYTSVTSISPWQRYWCKVAGSGAWVKASSGDQAVLTPSS